MRLSKKILILSVILFFAFMHNVNAIYNSNSGTAYKGDSNAGCGNTKNCYKNTATYYFMVQVRLYYINDASFTQIGETYYFVNTASYNALNGKVNNLIKVTNFDGFTANSANYNAAYNYIKNTYLNNNSETFLNKITSTDNYDIVLNKDIDRTNKTKGYRLMIEPAENYANPTFIDSDSTEDSALYTTKGLATEIMRLNSLGTLNEYANESNRNKELIQGVQKKAPYLYQNFDDVGVESKSENACSDLTIERISDIKYGCGYKLIDISSYISDKLCYAQDGVSTKNGGLSCTKYDENNEEEYKPKYKSIGSSCVESVKLNILKDYGKLVGGTNSCGIYCNEVAEVSYPGNVLNPVQVGSYFSWPSRYDDITGKYSMSVKTKLVCHTVGTQSSTVGSVYQKKCPTGYEEWSGYVNVDGKNVFYDLCKATDYQEPVCPDGTVLYTDGNTETCRSIVDTPKVCPSGYETPIASTNYCRNNTTANKICPDGYPNVYNNKCYKACAQGYVFKNGECRKQINFTCSSSQYTSGGSCYDKAIKQCQSGYTATGQTGNNACRQYVRTDYSCSSGYTMQTNDNTAYCCTGSSSGYCYSKGVCSGSYVSKSLGTRYCWKYRGDSSAYYHCDRGYAKWDSAGNTCWKCNQHMYTRWETHDTWAGPWGETSDINQAWYCGTWYQSSGRTAYCSSGYKASGGSCVKYTYTYNENASTCSRKGGSFINQDRNGKATSNGTGTCKFTSWKSMQYTTTYSWYYTEGGWVQGTARWEWEYKAPNATNVYNYQPVKCPSGYPTDLGDGYCRSNSAKAPSTCSGNVFDNVCYSSTDKSTPQSTDKICPSGTYDVNGTCYQYKEKECDLSKTVEISGKCYEKTTKVCNSKLVDRTVEDKVPGDNKTPIKKDYHDKVCPDDYPNEENGKCYKYVAAESVAAELDKSTPSTTNDRVCDSTNGWSNNSGGSGNTACKKQTGTDYSCPSGTTRQTGSGSTLKCEKYNDYYCDSGYSLQRNDTGTYCCNGNNCYAKGSSACVSGWPEWKPNGNAYCWKWSKYSCNSGYTLQENDAGTYCCKGNECYTKGYGGYNCDSTWKEWKPNGNAYCWKWEDFWCDSGYGKWTTNSKSCWKCDINGGWLAYYGNTRIYISAVNESGPGGAGSCGWWPTSSGTSCPKGTFKIGSKCYKYVYNYNAKLCSQNGGTDWQQTSQTTRNGTGRCTIFVQNATSYTSSSDWVEGGWSQGNTYWTWSTGTVYHEWLYGTRHGGDYTTLNRIETPTYSYQAKNKCPSSYPNSYNGKCYANCSDTTNYSYSNGVCTRKTDKCVNKYNNTCYKACPSGYTFQNGKCLKCTTGSLQSNGTCRIGTDKVCPATHPTVDGERCSKARDEANYCKDGSFNETTKKFTFTSTGHTYIKGIDTCTKCTSGYVTSDGMCGIKKVVKLPETVSTTGNPPCYETTEKINDWSCPNNYSLVGTKCVNNCSKETLVNGVITSLSNSVSANLKGGTNQEIDDELVATTAVTYDDSTTTFKTETTFKIKENTNRYYNKSNGLVANSASGWNSKDVFDRKEGVISLSLNDPVTENGVVKKYPLEIKNSKFGLVENYGNYINNYVCRYKTTTNSCKCPSGTDFAGISLYDLTGNICNLEDNDNTCAELQYKYCNKPSKYYCKNSSDELVNITSCVDEKIHDGKKPYNAFLECRNDTSECTKTCNYACKGDCNESTVETGNVTLNITKCDGKYCNISPYCKTDGAVVSSSSLECMAVYLNLRSGQQLKNKLNSNNITLNQVKEAAKACESTICGKQKVIFRTVDLGDPFYGNGNRNFSGLSLNGHKARQPGSNWNSVELVNDRILNGRDEEGNKIYSKNYLYKIVLTPQNTKDIREYNKTHSYSTFDLKCNDSDKTYGCISNFIHGDSDSLKELGVEVSGVSTCTSINLLTSPTDYKKCYNAKN